MSSDDEEDDSNLFADFDAADEEALARAPLSANLLCDIGRSAEESVVHRGDVSCQGEREHLRRS